MALFSWLLEVLIETQAGGHGAVLGAEDLETMLQFLITLLRALLLG